MGPLRFELRFRRPERRRMDQATLRSLTGTAKAHQRVQHDLKPIIFVLNNHGYLIERMLSEKLDYCYNDLTEWQYYKLPDVLGCNDWITRKVTTCGDLDKVMGY